MKCSDKNIGCENTWLLFSMRVGPLYLVWEAQGLRQFADLAERAEILVQTTNHLLDALLVRCLSRAWGKDEHPVREPHNISFFNCKVINLEVRLNLSKFNFYTDK